MGFNGSFDLVIDDKGRISIPSKFGKELQSNGHESLYITNFVQSDEYCLLLFPAKHWDTFAAKFHSHRTMDDRAQLIETFFLAGAHEVPIDRQGRILIPQKLREFAGIEREVILTGKNDRMELWEQGRFKKIWNLALEMVRNRQYRDSADI
ncbi:MAG TPA: division/cell wall cluster transcriptional repressor MraZ [Candidatus Binataceae bacterium]|nr:division/cell wall cluster transcriptional repressor MraZ [Candidatus Binataceae bacterium]